jgi:hypothetical protein
MIIYEIKNKINERRQRDESFENNLENSFKDKIEKIIIKIKTILLKIF